MAVIMKNMGILGLNGYSVVFLILPDFTKLGRLAYVYRDVNQSGYGLEQIHVKIPQELMAFAEDRAYVVLHKLIERRRVVGRL